ncbi:7-deoxyloganetic acid glucosyltransferase-like [Silene latifolia]|uniref:7-deoxyloganetic acid glucosyltransferase-like n=1 Tax=Silene latifolia TaxID=37657 RepID=UPI003D77E30B
MENQNSSKQPHVLIIPHPLQGHVNPMLHLAEIFCLANFNVTFLSSTHIYNHLTLYTDFVTRFSHYTGLFEFKAIPDGLPDDHIRAGDDGAQQVCLQFKSNLNPILKEMLDDEVVNPVTCLVVDGWLPVAHDLATQTHIPVIMFRCFSASNVWVYFSIPNLVQTGELPFKDDQDMDGLVQNAPGLDSFLRYRDLPRFCREKKDMSSCQALEKLFEPEIERNTKAHALIVNTCQELEGPLLDLIRSRCPNTYSIGPLNAHLRTRLNTGQATLSDKSSKGQWEGDRSCMSWLDEKPDKSVLYVSFGSVAMLEREQLIELWAGLVQSQNYFLWAVRPNLIIGTESGCQTLEELSVGTRDRGYIVGWVPQEEVLGHRAVGGFLTHSGWNSTLESVTAGVPMLCWPYFGDQQVNSRLVSEVWKVGLDMKDTCDRNVVAKMVGDLMVSRKDELLKSVARLSDVAMRSVNEGGTSYSNLDHLIQDIKQCAQSPKRRY